MKPPQVVLTMLEHWETLQKIPGILSDVELIGQSDTPPPQPKPRQRRIPPTGSFVIRPRMSPPTPPTPTPEPPVPGPKPQPSLWWERVLRLLGIDA